MITGTVLNIVAPKTEPGLRVNENAFSNFKLKKSFLYIGNSSDRTTNCLSFFDYSHNYDTFDKAKDKLLSLHEEGSIPDFIIVDQKLKEKEFSNFVLWLHSNKWSFLIPVMFNETILNEGELIRLKELNLADDIVNIEEYCNQLGSKALFLTESKINRGLENQKELDNSYKLLEQTPIGKRIFDIVVASILLIIASPILLLIALIIKLESKGPVIYSSKRAGRGFKVFKFHKFRTMIQDADQKIDEYSDLNVYGKEKNSSPFFKLKNDPRVTRFGSFLRNTSLDELPQLFNVIKGDMSIVGNRPLPLYEASTLTTDKHSERFSAPAGITGLWQVTKRGKENMEAEERIDLDIDYARQQSFSMDCRILIMTPLALIQKSNV